MDAADACVVSSRDGRGGLVVRIGIPLADVYLEFLGGRCRPNTVLAAAYDLKVFFEVVARPPDRGRALRAVGVPGGHGGVSAATVRRRLSIVSGFFAFLQVRGDVAANPVSRGCRPAGSSPVRARASRWSARLAGCRGPCPRPR